MDGFRGPNHIPPSIIRVCAESEYIQKINWTDKHHISILVTLILLENESVVT